MIIMDVGLVISLYDVIKVGSALIHAADGKFGFGFWFESFFLELIKRSRMLNILSLLFLNIMMRDHVILPYTPSWMITHKNNTYVRLQQIG